MSAATAPQGRPAPAALRLLCRIDTDDSITVARGTLNGRPRPLVALSASEGGEDPTTILLSPGDARRLAARLLDFADHVDGKTPLVFFRPDAPTATYPDGHPSA